MRPLHHVTKEPLSVSQILTRHLRVPQENVSGLIAVGAVQSGRQRLFRDEMLPKGAHLVVYPKPARFPVDSVDWKKAILHQEKNFVVVLKPGGIPVHATLDNATENVLEALRGVFPGELYVTQRLDTPVSGLMVLARDKRFQARFNHLLAERAVKKSYLALTASAPASGRHVHFLREEGAKRRTFSLEMTTGAQRCEIEISDVTQLSNGFWESTIIPLTGRTHQIRGQLAALRTPVVNDSLYGYRGDRWSAPSGRREIALFSSRVAFDDKKLSHAPPWSIASPPAAC